MLAIGTEVEVLRLGPWNTPYSGKTGCIIAHISTNEYHVKLDEDPIPRWAHLGIYCFTWEVRDLTTKRRRKSS